MPTAGELARENPKSLGAGTRGPQSHKSQASRSLMGRLSLRARSPLKSHQYKCAFFGQICCQSSSSATAIQVENSLGGELVLDNVPIVTPNCDLVVPSLSLTVTLTIGHYDYDVVMIIFPLS